MKLRSKQVTIEANDQGGKWWVVVKPHNGDFRPSFEELHAIAMWVAVCEQDKYPSPKAKGALMVAEFYEEMARQIRETHRKLKPSDISDLFLPLHRKFKFDKPPNIQPDHLV